MNTFMHEKAQFASTLKGMPVYLACTPADITLLLSRGMGFIQCLFTEKLLDSLLSYRRQQVLQLLELTLVSGHITLSWITPGDSG